MNTRYVAANRDRKANASQFEVEVEVQAADAEVGVMRAHLRLASARAKL